MPRKRDSEQETELDEELQLVMKTISNGWPTQRSQTTSTLHPYWSFRDELCIENGILFKNAKIIIPKTLQRKYLEKIHNGHQGIQRSLQKAREYVFWTNYTRDIKETIEKCSICQENSTALKTEKFKYVSTIPPHPWHTLGTDLFYFKKQDFMVLIDYFSKFLIVRKLHNSTSSAVIKELGLIFSEFGKPFILRSDNGPCYTSSEFQFFLKEWEIQGITSSPYYHQSNGLAESMVKTSKTLIEKALQQHKPWFWLLNEHRVTPLSDTIPSPAEILFGRRCRSNLSLLPSQLMNPRISKQREEIARKEQNFHQIGSELDLEVGQPIWHQDPKTKKWTSGRIHQQLEEPHSYAIQDSDGTYYRRNRNWIKPRQTNESTAAEVAADSDKDIHPDHLKHSSEASASGPATSTTVDAIPTVKPTSLQATSPVRGSPVTTRISARSTKGIAPRRYGWDEE